MRPIGFALLCIFPLTSYAAPPLPACEVQSATWDSQDVSCLIPAATEGRRLEFIARFSGGHDDTSASIEPHLDGQPLKCDEGSKISLFGEDGDVSVYCQFTVRGGEGSDSRLKVTVRWRHAQYADFALTSR